MSMRSGTKANLFYEILAGGARTRLLESVVNFNLPEIMGEQRLSESELVEKLQLHPLRAKKWFFLLTREGFLHREPSGNTYHYRLGPVLRALYLNNENQWWFFKQMTYSWQTVAYENFYNVLRGGPVSITYQWPPHKEDESVAIEEWMTNTAISPLQALEAAIDFNKVHHLLDIGGGEATMACHLAKKYPHLDITVYNLPKACELARAKIQAAGLSRQVRVVEGDFLKDKAFPGGFDHILFSRVLCDWSPKTARKLLRKAYNALDPNGNLLICEAFQESNQDFSLAWELRYVFWDELETEVFKSSLTYKKILLDLGFKLGKLTKSSDDCIYGVLTATKKTSKINLFQKALHAIITRKYAKALEVAG